jgi:hypothetical protein
MNLDAPLSLFSIFELSFSNLTNLQMHVLIALLQVFSVLFCLTQCISSKLLSFVTEAHGNFDDPGGQASSSNCSACHNKNLYLRII